MSTEVETEGLHEAMTPKIAITPFWTTPSQIFYPRRELTSPNKDTFAPVGGVTMNTTWYGAAEKALAAVNPFAKTTAVQNAIADQVQAAGQRTTELLKNTAETMGAAGSGIKSGFQWAMFLILLGLAFYVFVMVSPFIPKPRTA